MKAFDVLDIETFTHANSVEVYCICCTSNHNIITFCYSGGDVFLRFLQSLTPTQHTFWIHNLTFDALILLKHIDKHCTNITWFSKNYNIYWIKFQYKEKNIEFKCFYKYLPLPLNTLAIKILHKEKQIFPYKVLDMDFLNITLWTPNKDAFKSETEYKTFIKKHGNGTINIKNYLLEYCKNDVALLYEIVTKFVTSLQYKNVKLLQYTYSISSYAVKYCTLKYNNFQKKLPQNLEHAIRESYFGGRCEVFGNAHTNEYTYHFDFHGMYSLCMKEQLPTYNFRYAEPRVVDKPGFYKITYTSNLHIPILPIKTDLLYFPNGQNTGTYWYEEIKLFIQEGGTINTIHFAILCDVDYCLKEFSQEFDDFRNEGLCQNIIGKLVINSFYGRLGVQGWNYKDVIAQHPVEGAISYIKVHNLYVNKIKTITNDYNNVALASAITSKARIRLYNAFKDVLVGGGRLLYCDTDSIVAAFRDQNMLNRTHKSGLWFDSQKKDTIIQKSWFASPKTYSIIFKNNTRVTKIKGIPTNTITHEQFTHLFFTKKPLKIITPPTLYKKDYIYKIETFKKTIQLNNYKKRTFIHNYLNTKPITMDKVHTINNRPNQQPNNSPK